MFGWPEMPIRKRTSDPMSTKHAARRVPKVVGTGLVSLDVVVSADLERAPRLYAGGTCGNVLAILAYFGWDSFPLARLGADQLANKVLRDLKRWKVHCDFLKLPSKAPTPVILERIREDGSHRFSVTCPDCGHWFPSYRPVTLKAVESVLDDLVDADVFFFDRASPGAIKLAEACSESGTCVVFEPSSVGHPELFRKAVGVSHIVKYACDRLSNLPEIGELPRPMIEIITLGGDGLQLRSRIHGAGRDWHTLPAFSVKTLRDSAGAGDWLTATMIALIERRGFSSLNDLDFSSLRNIIEYAQAASAWNCAYEGARGGMYELDCHEFWPILDAIVSGSAGGCEAYGQLRPSRSKVAANAVCISCGDPVAAAKKQCKSSKQSMMTKA